MLSSISYFWTLCPCFRGIAQIRQADMKVQRLFEFLNCGIDANNSNAIFVTEY